MGVGEQRGTSDGGIRGWWGRRSGDETRVGVAFAPKASLRPRPRALIIQ